ncbi:inner nuclear membrane protein Man1 [Athalia rosae]|uniref:inner nuclear membrane protein Man1 n=1 Tax=Athalia rosae TaxID=37344 RepID=UPI00203387B8|nr:inner nuclear membrane protein Man1 [Athalia rosae]XP_048506106.1 inner nuclear membrane protein Man1 [Athalia rosae]XP_048506107.1 inner nuclear membrane protein Man1 [Athalia rosae]XP_048506108.1 inner nuclear membrane protein Man1 [Athalia rosae]XP_048506109.1 inner nuclear membrane protein Man1 [Athalia rosae]
MSVETLSDSELRSKLAEYGYPVGPVTLTTRNILVKKLKKLIEDRESGFKGSNRQSLAAKYSSDDTDDDSVSTGKKKKSSTSRRQTLANPMPPPAPAVAPKSPSRRRTASRTNSHDTSLGPEPYVQLETPVNVSTKSVKSVSSRKVTRNYKSLPVSADGLETGSDSDITDEPEKHYSTSKYKVNETKPRETTSYVPTNLDYEPSAKPYESKQRSIFTNNEDNYVASNFKVNISPIQSRTDEAFRDKEDPLANIETPYLSDFTRRLSRISSSQLPSRSSLGSPILRHSPALPEVKETDTNGHFSSLQSKYLSPSTRYNILASERPAIARTFPLSSDGKELKNNHNLISVILLGVLLLFFIVLAVVYLGLGAGKNDAFSSSDDNNHFPFCSADVPNWNKPGVNCILRGTEGTAVQLLKILQFELTRKAISYNCEDTTDVPYMTDADVAQLSSKNLDEIDLKEDLYNAQLLILQNPKWGISLIEVDDQNKDSTDIKIIDKMERVLEKRLNGKVGMVVLHPDVPMKCLIKNKLYTMLTSILAVAVGALLIIGGHKLLLWHLRQKKESENEVFRLVSEIISMLEMHHQNAAVASPGGTQENYLAINHVRDNLIPPKDRIKMASIWNKAVKFLDENESRVRQEVQQVTGEEFHVWRWLPSNNLNTSSVQTGTAGNKKTKVWQGQAFETMEGSVNSLPCSPTPCLKIRYMFDPDVEFEDDWETKVQDAILEKCGEDVKILHIRVDRGSREGCVYMKCMSQEDAGKAYRALHGWWFDSKLVTVKYLRLERYRERFPDSLHCVTPLKPSNNQRLSMQAHNWQSPSETI